MFDSLASRAAYLLGKLKRKLSRNSTADWSEEEISELGHGLQTSVRAAVADRARLSLRVQRLTRLVRRLESEEDVSF